MSKFKITIFTLLSMVAVNSHAVGSGYRFINNIGCHLNDGTCYVYVDGDAVGPTDCSSNSIRWNKDNANSGKETLSLLMTAAIARKKVNFQISNSCYKYQAGYPTFTYIILDPQ